MRSFSGIFQQIAFRPVWALAVIMLVGLNAFAQVQMQDPTSLFRVSRNGTFYAVIGAELFRSLDDGKTWKALWLKTAGGDQPSLTGLVIDPDNPAVLYASTSGLDGWLWKSKDQGNTWMKANTGLPELTSTVASLFDTLQANSALYILIGRRVYKSTDRALSWGLQAELPVVPGVLDVNEHNPRIMFAGLNSNEIHRSLDEGKSWARMSVLPGGRLISLRCDPDDSMVVHSSTGPLAHAFLSSDQGASWRQVSQPGFYSYAFGPPGSRLIYGIGEPWRTPLLYRSVDGGATWAATATQLKEDLDYGRLLIVPDRSDQAQAWAGAANGLWRSSDRGDSWSRVEGQMYPTLRVSPPAITLNAPPSADDRFEFTLWCGASCSSCMVQRLKCSLGDGQVTWLTGLPASGTTQSLALLRRYRVNAGSLSPGTYSTAIQVTSIDSTNAVFDVPVSITVQASAPAMPSLIIQTVAGGGTREADGPAIGARISPRYIAVDSAGNIYFTEDQEHRVRKVSASGQLTTFAGNGKDADSGDGGQATSAGIRDPGPLAVDADGNVYIGEFWGGRVRMVKPDGTITTQTTESSGVGGMAIDRSGHVLYIVNGVGTLWKWDLHTRDVSILYSWFSGLSLSTALTVDSIGHVILPDSFNSRIRLVGLGSVEMLAGNGVRESWDSGSPAAYVAVTPQSAVVDDAGYVFFSEPSQSKVRVLTPEGFTQTLIGACKADCGGDGGPASAAKLMYPFGLAIDASGNIYVADESDGRIRKLVRTGAAVPMFSTRAVVNAASYRQAAVNPVEIVTVDSLGYPYSVDSEQLGAITPGEIVTLFGSTLGPQSLAPAEVGTNGRLKSTVAETTVLFDGVAAPIIYVWDRQTSVVAPYSLAGKQKTAIQVEYRGRRSAPVVVNVADAAPGLFTADQSGIGLVVAFNQDYTQNTLSSPAEPGSIVMLFLTGEGLLDPSGVDGARPEGPTFPRPQLPVSATIQGILADVLFAGQTFAGVTQVNVRIPEGVHPGVNAQYKPIPVDVQVRVGPVSTQVGTTIAVK